MAIKPEALQDTIRRLTESAIDSRMHTYLKQDFSNISDENMSTVINRVSSRIADSVICRELIAEKVKTDIINSRKKSFMWFFDWFCRIITFSLGAICTLSQTFRPFNEFVCEIVMKFLAW